MSFAHPAVLLLLALPLVLAAWEWRRAGHPLVLPFDHGRVRSSRGLEHLVKAFQLTAPILLALAILLLAGPQRFRTSDQTRVLNNVIFLLDVSGSMSAPFGDGTRSDKAIAAIVEFSQWRKGDAFGLTTFDSDVLHWLPVTKDLAAVAETAPFLNVKNMPPSRGGTMIGHGVRQVAKLLASTEGDRMVVLVTDGEAGDLYGGVAEQIGRELAAEHITLFYVHTSSTSPQQETIPLASLSGGKAFPADDPESLRDVFRRIDEMRPTRFKPSSPVPVDFHWPFTTAALGVLVLQLGAVLRFRFTPW